MRASTLPLTLVGVLFLIVGCGQHRSVPTAPAGIQLARGVTAPAAPAAVQPAGAVSGKLKVDQSNGITDQLGLGSGLYGQTFVPKAKNLAQVDLLLTVNQIPPEGVWTTVGLFPDITQTPIATTDAFVGPPAPGELRRTISYRFDPPIPLSKGRTYTLGMNVPANVAWDFAFGDHYPSGAVVLYDGAALNPPADFVFTTYELK